MKLFEGYVEPEKPIKLKKLAKKKGIIRIHNGIYTFEEKRGQGYVSVEFEGYNEGSGSPCDTEEEAQKHIEYLIEKHKDNYKIEVIDERKI
jgi:hypothetical protein